MSRDLSWVLIPVALFVGVTLGTNGAFDFTTTIPALLGAVVGLYLMNFLIGVITDALAPLYAEHEPSQNLGETQELVILAIKQGEVVGEMRTWGPSLAEGKRKFWAKKLPRLFTRRAREVAPSEQ